MPMAITNIVQDLGVYFPKLAQQARAVSEEPRLLMTDGGKNDKKGRRFLVGVGSARDRLRYNGTMTAAVASE